MSSAVIPLPPLSLYVHIPWCIKKCPYCDFNSHSSSESTLPEQEYLEALERDLSQSSHQAQGRQIASIFFGGGTPSLFNAQSIGRIIEMAQSQIGLTPDCEITLEANPGTFEQKKFSGYRQVGVNRLSIGIQSFNPDMLKALGRIHNADEALGAVSIARRAGFDNINLDLMYGLPNQSQAQAMADLQQAIGLHPEHISWYELTIEPNTEFYSSPPVQADIDQLGDMSDEGIALLAENGYQRYETSAFCEKNRQSRHNLNYWRFGDYIGIGAGAHGKYTDQKTGMVSRQSKTRLPKHYLERIGSYVANESEVPKEDLLAEYMMNALRLIDGVSIAEACERTGLAQAEILSAADINIQKGLLSVVSDQLKPTDQGQRLLNLCLQSFL
jgi:putative oxygen-independent coproporphyrinogen III oxidase